MSYMKTKTKPKSKKEIVLDGDNPQDYAEWETEMKFKIKTKLGAKRTAIREMASTDMQGECERRNIDIGD